MDITKSDNCLSVQLLGNFSVTANGIELTSKSARSAQIWTLFKYLVLNRNNPVPIRQLVDLLWDEGECEDPISALYTLVYRLRNILNKNKSTPQNFFEFSLNSYIWIDPSSVELDCEKFEKLFLQSCVEKDSNAAIELLTKAIDLYKGELILDVREDAWMVVLAEKYRLIYINAVSRLCDLLIEQHDYSKIPTICNNAIKLDRFCEDFYYYHIFALVKLNRFSLARNSFDYAQGIMVSELGTTLSERIASLMTDQFKNDDSPEISIDKVAKLLGNDDVPNLPFLCDINTFRKIFLFTKRISLRTKTSFCLVSATITSDKVLLNENILGIVMDTLATATDIGIRCSDVISQYSHTQILLLLTNSSYENTKKAMKRFSDSFLKNSKTSSIKFKFSIKLFN